MAEPPNKLTALIGGWTDHRNTSPEEIYEVLRRERCLSPEGLQRRNEAMMAIKKGDAESRRNAEQRLAGATREYIILGHLGERGFLNSRARRWLNSVLIRQHWCQFWRR
jgi:hypothetical protein